MKAKRFNVRVYGLLVDENHRVLVTDERRGGYLMTKFPGGGLEFGEGLANGLQREWREELDVDIELGDLFYINDFLQISTFNPQEQLLSVYYKVFVQESAEIVTASARYDFPNGREDAQIFRWLSREDLAKEEFTFPVDRVVVERLLLSLI